MGFRSGAAVSVVVIAGPKGYARSQVFGYLLIFVAISVAVGVGVYRATGRMAIPEHDPAMWAGGGPAGAAPPPPPTNFERLSIARDRLTWHDRIIGSLGLVVVVAVGAASLAFAFYLVGTTAISLLEKAAGGAP